MKYIDVNKLKEKIYAEDTVSLAHGALPEFDQGCHHAFLTVLSFIDSLQQEQLPGIEEPGVPGKDFIPVEWVDACEKYGKWKIVQQEVDLEKEIQEYIQKLGFGYGGWVDGLSDEDLKNIARYFYELGLKAK